MKTTNQNTNAQADGASVVSKPHQCIKLGLDVHADSIRVVRMIDGATPQPAQKMTPDEFPAWAVKQLALADKVCSCYEAGPLGYGLHRKLTAAGIENIVIRPLVLDEYRKRVKTDKTDALALAKRLDAYVRGNRKAFAVVRVPTEQEEQERTLSRQREQLVREVRRVRGQGRSLMLFHGIRVKGVWWRWHWNRVTEKLPAWLVERLEVFRAVLQVLDQQIRKLTLALEAQAPAARPRGLGPLGFEVIRREIGDWNRFANRRQIGSYCLTSYSSQSKGVDCVFVAESSESFRAAGREQFYVSVSRFKEALTIYTDDKRELLNAVGKSSHRPSATDLVTKEISESVNESAATPSPSAADKNVEREISETQKFNWLHKQKIRQSQSRGVGM